MLGPLPPQGGGGYNRGFRATDGGSRIGPRYGRSGEAPRLSEASHRGALPGAGKAARGRGCEPRTDRRHRHGLPVPRRGAIAAGPVALGGVRVRHRRRVPGGPGLGPGGSLRSEGRAGRQDVHGAGQLPRRSGGLRPRGLRHLAARGAGDGSPAATPPRDELGDVRTCRHRSAVGARPPGRSLHRAVRHRLRGAGGRHATGRPRGVLHHRQRHERRVRPRGLQLRPERTRDHGGHRVLVVAGVHSPRHAGAAQRRVRTGAGGRGDRHGDPRGVRGVQPPARTGPGRPVQGILRRCGRHGVGRRRGDGRVGTAVRRRAQGSPDTGCHPWQRGEPGRRQQRPDRPEQAGSGAGDRAGAGQCGTRPGRRRRGRGARHRHEAGRSDRGVRPAGRLRPRPPGRPAPVARLGEVESRAHPGRRGRRRGDQDDHGDAVRRPAEDLARRPADPARRLVRGCSVPAHREPGVAGVRSAPAGGGLVVRHQRHQRTRRPGGGPTGRATGG
ncbi:Uncharacterised protein [Rhodococcus wratislaviensis]|uniref:LigA n=1 Tax=Rhodococcus wratislaviensis TaxID=44752 RepID=A0AB38FFD6_RHOWR|nr:Uncharacterised protein [Rhodococcus wratislaviensis]